MEGHSTEGMFIVSYYPPRPSASPGRRTAGYGRSQYRRYVHSKLLSTKTISFTREKAGWIWKEARAQKVCSK